MSKIKEFHKTAKKNGFYKKALVVVSSLFLLAMAILPFIISR